MSDLFHSFKIPCAAAVSPALARETDRLNGVYLQAAASAERDGAGEDADECERIAEQFAEAGRRLRNLPRIVAVAFRFRGVVISLPRPSRHHHLIARLSDFNMEMAQVPPDDQGFLTDRGEYVTRERALEIAARADQILPRPQGGYDGPLLFSEDLW